MTLQSYLINLQKRFKTGIAREHAYRGDLQNLLEALAPEVLVTNEPARIACGAPDYVLTKNNIPVGYIEAKDIGVDLKSKTLKAQFNRYKASLDNLIFTDYLDFHLYIDGELVTTIAIAAIEDGEIVSKPENFAAFESLIKDFATHIGQTIKSSAKLSQMMAGKAKMLAQVIEKALLSDEENESDSTLKQQMHAFKQILIHDIQPKEFGDIYAQTIAYGMFAARLHDPTLATFSRQEAAELIPKSNPFLRKLFQYISGYDIDDRIEWIVSALADIFRATDVGALLQNFGKATQLNDPIIHFYENFLAEYDPKLRKARGVWYTPAPVVNFIVRAVDDVLKTEFGLKKGLADTSKTKIQVQSMTPDKRSKTGYRMVEKEVHRVQILDPATGTGTFLAEVVKHIYSKNFKAMQGMWSGYVEKDLIPRLNGFELLMASYAMAHLKLDMLLTETGYKSTSNQRFRIFLTNSLEEAHPDTGTLFASWLSDEANQANGIKRDAPVMVVLGNPPYSGESANKGQWIMDLMDDYKKEPGGKEKLKERNPKWINDDYVKFMRYGQHFVEKNGEGILAFINPHGFLDNPTFRGMRWNLLKTYDTIYTIDLHGNSKKKETCPDGSPDVNVFDIQQGVSINILVKTGKKKTSELGKIFHFDLYGKRELKYDFLWKNSLQSIDFNVLPNKAPMYFMVQKDFEAAEKYEKGFKITDCFNVNSVGIVTARDALTIQGTKEEVKRIVHDFAKLDIEEARVKYKLGKDARDWKVHLAQKDLLDSNLSDDNICRISYRPFDVKYTYYTGNSKGFQCMPRGKVMHHLSKGKNIGIVIGRQGQVVGNMQWNLSFITNNITDFNLYYRGGGMVFPLYLYNSDSKDLFDKSQRIPNLNPKIITEIAKKLDLTFVPEKEAEGNVCMANSSELRDDFKTTFAPIDLLDYIYAVLHSPNYRETYKEFLKIDFPRVPYPTDTDVFWKLVALGGELRQWHLLEHPRIEDYITSYPKDGDNLITRKMTKRSIGFEATSDTHGRVWVNDEQYFDGVPLVAWEFYIGGYQPAQKWLKDRVGRVLDFEDILHYQQMIVALTETSRVMEEVDLVLKV